MDKKKGVYSKFIVKKTDGSPIDPSACLFVLRLDDDIAARKAMRVYVKECDDEELATDINRCLDWLEDPPSCTCGGGRNIGITCPFHDGGYFGHPVWRYGTNQ